MPHDKIHQYIRSLGLSLDLVSNELAKARTTTDRHAATELQGHIERERCLVILYHAQNSYWNI